MTHVPAIEVGEVNAHGIVLVTIKRPDRLNALTEMEHDALATIWTQFDERPEVKVVVVTGEGKAFSAGGDLDFVREVTQDDTVRANAWWAARGIVKGVLDCRKPIISALEGVAVGAGNAVALMADICIAAETAKIVDGHLAFGASPGDHAAFLWPLAMGVNRARGKLLLGEALTGSEAADLGLVYEAVPKGKTLSRAMELAERIAGFDQFAVQATKVSTNGILKQNWQTFEAGLALEFMCFTNGSTRNALVEASALKTKSSTN
ncbi:enoyl-CoA hydratase/isomerase family protein [Rhodococcus sp. USK10]|uniref:Enoyl-CoA hydratase n=1 Tax=Rhodococcus wratislaviensis TaxID=44752 RepID=A0A402CEV6_RHOWR|nr:MULTISPECIES: enoyl-CoA hydratase-related protein [Rhodococcus]QYB07102.1 enoyl-CoA hydratase/isomerase family protein [Rhodococcus sp. USK10]GCE42140.1 Enoyl-CoA hydratase [Rhodococcus wratislaviensis]